jgi:hypothetical protein
MVTSIDKAIMLKSTEELMRARADHVDDSAMYTPQYWNLVFYP